MCTYSNLLAPLRHSQTLSGKNKLDSCRQSLYTTHMKTKPYYILVGNLTAEQREAARTFYRLLGYQEWQPKS